MRREEAIVGLVNCNEPCDRATYRKLQRALKEALGSAYGLTWSSHMWNI